MLGAQPFLSQIKVTGSRFRYLYSEAVTRGRGILAVVNPACLCRASGLPSGVELDLSELRSFAAERRARALSARELADQLSDQEERLEILRYANDLDRDVARLDAQIAAKRAAQNAIDVI